MLEISEALRLIYHNITPSLDYEPVSLIESDGRILAEDIVADTDLPPFDRASMDGYAIKSGDGITDYKIIEYIPASLIPSLKVGRLQAARIMTGAIVPEGADTVVAVESTSGYFDVGQMVRINKESKAGGNIAKKGESFKKSELLLPKGELIDPYKVSVFATVGKDPVMVFKKPSVSVISTGNELLEPSVKQLPLGKIRNASSIPLALALKRSGADLVSIDSAKDTKEKIRQALEKASTFKFTLVTGGVSAGDKDLVKEIVSDLGYETIFHKVKIKPGKPLLFAKKDGNYLFGLPGNPVSSLFIYSFFVKEAIGAFFGKSFENRFIESTLDFDIKRKVADRTEFIPVKLRFEAGEYHASKIKYLGSGDILGLAKGTGFIIVDIGMTSLDKGTKVKTLLFQF